MAGAIAPVLSRFPKSLLEDQGHDQRNPEACRGLGSGELVKRLYHFCKPMEDSVVMLELPIMQASHDAQDSCHYSFSYGQNRSNQEHFGSFPHALAENLFKDAQHVYNLAKQIKILLYLFFFVNEMNLRSYFG